MKKKLTKSNTDSVLTGTLAGIAEYFNIDPTILRIAFAFFTIFGIGSPVLLYIALALVIPSKPGRTHQQGYGRDNPYYRGNSENQPKKDVTNTVKNSKEPTEEDWSDF